MESFEITAIELASDSAEAGNELSAVVNPVDAINKYALAKLMSLSFITVPHFRVAALVSTSSTRVCGQCSSARC